MFIDFKKIFSVIFVLAVGAGIGVGVIKIIDNYKAPKQTVSVTGTGEVDATTDQATINVQIKNTSTTYEKAQEENKKDVDTLKSGLTKLGIPESRITISSSSQPFFSPGLPSIDYAESSAGKMMPPYKPETTPTVITNLTLILDPIKNIEKIFDVVSSSPNAQITNTYYSLKNRKTWEAKAKEDALKDARNQVETIAKINRLRVGKLLTVEDGSSPRPYPMMKALDASVTAENYYSEQSVKITSSYTATYELY